MMKKLEFRDADGDVVNITLEAGGDGRPVLSLDLRVGVGVLSLDAEMAKYLIGILSHYAETGELREPGSAEQAAAKFLNGLGDEIKGVAETVERLTERVAALEGGAKKPLPYGLWNLEGGNWHSSSPFESAGDASRYAHKSFYRDWRNQWRVYPYPEDGGKPVELREKPEPEEKWGLWGTNGETALVPELHWYGPDDANYLADSKDAVLKIKEECISIGEWNPYPYPADGGMPMELRETQSKYEAELGRVAAILQSVHPMGKVKAIGLLEVAKAAEEVVEQLRSEVPVTVSPGGTNYVYDQPKLPTLWGVWLEPDNRWSGSHIGEGSIAFFRSKVASEKYASKCGGEARPLPIEELIKDA